MTKWNEHPGLVSYKFCNGLTSRFPVGFWSVYLCNKNTDFNNLPACLVTCRPSTERPYRPYGVSRLELKGDVGRKLAVRPQLKNPYSHKVGVRVWLTWMLVPSDYNTENREESILTVVNVVCNRYQG